MPIVEVSHPEPDTEYLTPCDLAERWRMSEATLANQRSRGEGIPYLKVIGGNRVLYRLTDVLAAEKAGTRGFSWAKLNDAIWRELRLKPVAHEKLMLALRLRMG